MSAAPRYYVVQLLDSAGKKVIETIETPHLAEALRYAKKSPYANVEQMTADGWLVHTEVFTPKHPIDAKTEKEVRDTFNRKAKLKGYSSWLDNPQPRKKRSTARLRKYQFKKGAARKSALTRAAFAIYAQGSGKKMHFDGSTRFTENAKPKLFATQKEAFAVARSLLKRFPKLRRYRVTVESF